ncbi:MAG: HD domain-containing protein [Clostridiales bacterium]|uniref:HD domain-containing protein n=1 Tax=Evtepia sp. TaxID=2773933 RepID=UPI0029840E18|nr:HD domain-containing protein [Evtepia sp.]MDD7288850.1 HD domain-containing protein [Clostridiales bacterium]MDY3992443.1 HD domain-containing protein [Evtepia sp.]MDY4430147.1 HD domain-containing protein [Evtepia sp.]
MAEKRLEDQMKFLLEIDKEKNILRQTHLSGHGRRENDAEHAWHMAIMIYLLREYANEKIDLAKTMMMALIHDIVEIDAGDTYAYDTAALATQQEREAKAAQRIFGLLPEDQREEMLALFQEFEDYETPEARFAHVLDNLQPLMLNDSNNGGDWREHQVKRSQVYKRNARTSTGSETLWAYMEGLIQGNVEKGNIQDC